MSRPTPPKNPDSTATSDTLYLDRLEFDPKLRESWLNFFVTRFRVVLLLIFLIVLWGAYSFSALPRESNPEVKIPVGMVITAFPGASPADVEELVTKKIEKEVMDLKGVDKVSASSANSVSSVSVEFAASEDMEDAIRRLRDAVENVKPDLPDDGNDPLVKEVSFDDQPIWTVGVTGPFDGQTLRRVADEIRDELEKIGGVREVTLSGGDETEIEIAYDPARLLALGISPDTANQAVRAANVVFPAGSFDGEKYRYTVRADARFFDAVALGGVPVMHSDDGAVVYLRDLATVTERSIKHTTYSRLSVAGSEPQNAVTLSIIKKTGGSIIDTVAAARAALDHALVAHPGLAVTTVIDYSKEIARNFDQLSHDFLITVLLVGGLLFLVVGLKEAFVAGLAVPLVFCVSFGVMLLTGISLNFLSLFSLILSLGLLVDDAIVVVSATKQYLRSGKFTPEEAVLLVLRDFKVVLTTTTLTTVWAFLPLLMASGMIGQFIKSIPITASVTLTASLVIALCINHPLAAVLERIRLTPQFFFVLTGSLGIISFFGVMSDSLVIQILGGVGLAAALAATLAYRFRWREQLQKNAELSAREWRDDELIKLKLREAGNAAHTDIWHRLIHGIFSLSTVLPTYEKWLRRAIESARSRRIVIGGAVALFFIAILLPVTGLLKSEFFPAGDQEYLFIDLEASAGLRLEETNQLIAPVEKVLLGYPEVESYSTVVGVGGSDGGHISGGSGSGSHRAGITVRLSDPADRERSSILLADLVRAELTTPEIARELMGARVTVDSPKGGPPSGKAFEARIVGEDLQTLDRIAHELLPILSGIAGVRDADISLKPTPAEYSFVLDRARMELLDVNAAFVGAVLRMAVSGTEVTTVVRGGDETKVIARFDPAKLPTLTDLQNLQILNLRRQPIFLRDVAEIQLTPSVDAITRLDGKRYLSLSAAVDAPALPTEVLTTFQQRVAQDYDLPTDYTLEYGGENEENAESVASILLAMRIALLLIIATLIIQFDSFRKALIVLVTIPLALTGVFFGLAVLQLPLSFPGLIGIVALFGIVVKNAIILMDKINLNLRSGIPYTEAIVDAGKSRLEAIVITSICTIFGILPVTLSDAVWMALGSSIICGLLLSSFLTLFIVPVLFVAWIRDDSDVRV